MSQYNISLSNREMVLARLNKDYTDEWDFKVVFPNATIVYIYKLDRSFSMEEIVTYVAKYYSAYIYKIIYAGKYPNDKEVDMVKYEKLKNECSKDDMEIISSKYIVFNRDSSMIF